MAQEGLEMALFVVGVAVVLVSYAVLVYEYATR